MNEETVASVVDLFSTTVVCCIDPVSDYCIRTGEWYTLVVVYIGLLGGL